MKSPCQSHALQQMQDMAMDHLEKEGFTDVCFEFDQFCPYYRITFTSNKQEYQLSYFDNEWVIEPCASYGVSL